LQRNIWCVLNRTRACGWHRYSTRL